MGPENTLDLLRSSGVQIVQLPEAQNGEQLLGNIDTLSKVLEKPADTIKADVRARLAELKKSAASLAEPPRVLFVRAQQGRGLKVAGTDTSPHSLIQLAGGKNAVEFSGYKTLTDEALLQLRPDWILFSASQAEQLKNGAALLQWQPLVKLTPAGKAQAFAALDDYALLGGIGLASLNEAQKLNRLFAAATPL
jgi:iron complex transport system substrate-binding protein